MTNKGAGYIVCFVWLVLGIGACRTCMSDARAAPTRKALLVDTYNMRLTRAYADCRGEPIHRHACAHDLAMRD